MAPLSYLPEHIAPKPVMPDAELSGRVFLRLSARDRPGVLSLITGALGDEGVGIASVVQREHGGGAADTVPVIVLTHRASEAALQRALSRIEALEEVTEPPRVIRIEEEV